MKVLLLGRNGKVGSVLGPALEEAGHELVGSADGADAAVDFTRPDAVEANVRACLEAGVPCVIGTTGFDQERVARARRSAPAAGLLRAQLRPRRSADDAVRRRGGQGPAGRCDCRAAPRDQARRALRHCEGDRGPAPRRHADPLHPAAGPGRAPGGDLRRAGSDADDPARHDLTGGVRAGRAARARAAPRRCRPASRSGWTHCCNTARRAGSESTLPPPQGWLGRSTQRAAATTVPRDGVPVKQERQPPREYDPPGAGRSPHRDRDAVQAGRLRRPGELPGAGASPRRQRLRRPRRHRHDGGEPDPLRRRALPALRRGARGGRRSRDRRRRHGHVRHAPLDPPDRAGARARRRRAA